MPDPLGIVVELPPDRVLAGLARIDGGLAQSEAKGQATGRSIGESFAQAARAAVDAQRQAQREIDQQWKEIARSAQQAARDQTAAQRQASQDSAAAARQGARDQEEYARNVTAAAERRARERAAADRAAAKAAADAARSAASAQERASQQAAAAAKAAADQQRQAQAKLRDSYREIVGPAAQFNERIAQANQLMRQGAINTQQYSSYVNRLRGEIKGFNANGGGGGGGGGIGGALGGILPGPLGAIAAPAAAVAATVAIGKEVLALSDSYQVLTNKIRVVTETEGEAARVREKLFDIADRTRSSNEGVVTVYTRLAASAKELGRSEAQLLQFTESLSKAVKISGATAQEAQAGLIQLAQGLGSGALRGDELRSVLEQLPAVADVIAKGLGVTRGQLRQLGADGKITADIVFNAFEKAKDSLDERFGKSVATVADLQQVLHNQIERTVGALVEQTGILPALAKGFEAVGAAIRDMAQGLGVAIDLYKQFDSAFQGPLREFMLGPLLGTSKGREFALGAAIPLTQLKNIATKDLSSAWRDQLDAIEKKRKEEEAQETIDAQARKFLETDSGAQQRFLGTLQTLKVGLEDALTDTKALERAEREAAQAAEQAARAHEQLLRQYEQLEAGLSSVYRAELQLANTAETLDKAIAAGITTRDRANQILAETERRLRDQLDPFAAAIEKIQAETDALGLDAEAHRRTAAVRQVVNDLRQKGVELTAIELEQLEGAVAVQDRLTQRYAAQRAVLESIRGPQQQYEERMRAASELVAAGAVTLDEYLGVVAELNPALVDLGQSVFGSLGEGVAMVEGFTDATSEAIQKVKKDAVDVGKLLADQLGSALGGSVDLLVDKLNGAETSFREFARSFLADLEKLIIKLILFQTIQATIGSGTLGGALSRGLGFAAGGSFIVPNGGGGTDSQPVFFRATPGERVTVSTPGQQAAQGGGATVINSKVVVVDDRHAAAREVMASADGEQIVIATIARNAGKIRAVLS